MSKLSFKIASPLIVVMLLTACTPKLFHDASDNVDKVNKEINQGKADYEQPAAAVVVKPGMYVDTKPRSLYKAPQWLSNRISLHGQDLPFSFYVKQILQNAGTHVEYGTQVNPQQKLTIDYSGTVLGALQELATKTNYAYQRHGKTISWKAFITRTFPVSFMPGNSQYLVGRQAGSLNSAATTLNNSGYASGINVNQGNQYSNLSGNLSVWRDLQNTLKELMSKDGKFYVSQSTTSVTVHDRPQNMRAIARYLQQLNNTMSQQVALQVQVLEIDLNKAFNFGLNWNLVRRNFNTSLSLSGVLTRAIPLDPFNTSSASASVPNVNFTVLHGPFKNTNLLINALKQQGKVSVVTQPRVVTMNNQIAEIGINTETSYIQSVSTTFTGGGSDFQSTSVTPGLVNSGFNLFLLPKIQNQYVFLQISSNISNLKAIQNVDVPSPGAKDPVTDKTTIQLPQVAIKRFNQRTMLRSGDTLILAGFKQIKNEANHESNLAILSGKGASSGNTETIIMITPTVLKQRG